MGLTLLELLVIFLVFYGTMRYFMDVTPTLVLLSIIGFWFAYHRLGNWRFWLVGFVLISVVLILFTVVAGVLVGFSSDIPRMKAANPALLPHARLFFISLARQISRYFLPAAQ